MDSWRIVASRKLSRKRGCGRERSPDAGYAATRFSSNLNRRTSKFGWLQATAAIVNNDFRSNFSPIQEGGCTECSRVSDTRCGTCVI